MLEDAAAYMFGMNLLQKHIKSQVCRSLLSGICSAGIAGWNSQGCISLLVQNLKADTSSII